jgi:hypothetical protein
MMRQLNHWREGMPSLAPGFGVQSLRHITARASSARVLDLHWLAKEYALDPEHRARPLFTHPVLNRTIIVKHHPRPGEIEVGDDRPVVTKIIFPFDPEDLDLGGQFLLTGDAELAEKLTRYLDYREEGDLERDRARLGVIDRLPTLDPFLLREALAAQGSDVAPCYFRLTADDRKEMGEFVAHQVETLIGLCFAGSVVSEAQAKRLSDLILSGGEDPELDPLREALRMAPGAFAEAMFCWKAVLYYRWRARGLGPELKATLKSIAGVQLSRFDPHAARFVRAALEQLSDHIRDCERRIAERFFAYDKVFEALTAQRTPEPFRRFLTQGPVVFADIGGSMGRLEQIISYWAYQFPGGRTRDLSPEAIFDSLRNLLEALSIGLSPARPERRQEARPRADEASADESTVVKID